LYIHIAYRAPPWYFAPMFALPFCCWPAPSCPTLALRELPPPNPAASFPRGSNRTEPNRVRRRRSERRIGVGPVNRFEARLPRTAQRATVGAQAQRNSAHSLGSTECMESIFRLASTARVPTWARKSATARSRPECRSWRPTRIGSDRSAALMASRISLSSLVNSDFAHSDDVDQSFRSDADQNGAKRRRAL
jgi:hypothetical protein